jgi:EAL domain-containing protein (putative c-di-GMP-specific phosphodiesterase class I)
VAHGPADHLLVTTPPVALRAATRRAEWEAGLERVLRDPGAVEVVFQPVVDLRRGTVAGYEALARFAGPPTAGPERWLAEAEARGVADELSARVLARALDQRRGLPPNVFLSVNVAPKDVAGPAVRATLLGAAPLGGVVIEVTEHAPIGDFAELDRLMAPFRQAGAIMAVDDAGAGYAGLTHILELRPQIVKLDRSLVSGIDRDEAKRVLVETIGNATGRLDAWLLAEGIERSEELDALVAMGVPLGQGYALGHPAPPWAGVPPHVAARIRLAAGRVDRSGATVERVLEERPVVLEGAPLRAARLFAADPDLDVAVVVTEGRRPAGLVTPEQTGQGAPPWPATTVQLSADCATVLRRAITRDRSVRFLPLVVCDELGRYVGVCPIERLIERLA